MSESSEAEVLAALPKVQVTKFIEENKKDFDDLKQGTQSIKTQMEGLDSITQELKEVLTKIDYNEVAQNYAKDPQEPKEAMLEKIFGKAYKLIEGFNEKAKVIEDNAKKVGEISSNLNKKNKGDENNKKEFEVIMGNFNDVNNLFR